MLQTPRSDQYKIGPCPEGQHHVIYATSKAVKGSEKLNAHISNRGLTSYKNISNATQCQSIVYSRQDEFPSQ